MSEGKESWGLHAFASKKYWDISLHERIDKDEWELEFVHGNNTLAFLISKPDVPHSMLAFFKENYGKTSYRPAKKDEYPGIAEGTTLFSAVADFTVETPDSTEVYLSKCGELPDRFHFGLIAGATRLHVDMHDPQTSDLIEALEQLITEIDP